MNPAAAMVAIIAKSQSSAASRFQQGDDLIRTGTNPRPKRRCCIAHRDDILKRLRINAERGIAFPLRRQGLFNPVRALIAIAIKKVFDSQQQGKGRENRDPAIIASRGDTGDEEFNFRRFVLAVLAPFHPAEKA